MVMVMCMSAFHLLLFARPQKWLNISFDDSNRPSKVIRCKLCFWKVQFEACTSIWMNFTSQKPLTNDQSAWARRWRQLSSKPFAFGKKKTEKKMFDSSRFSSLQVPSISIISTSHSSKEKNQSLLWQHFHRIAMHHSIHWIAAFEFEW